MFVLISTDREQLDIETQNFETLQKARDVMTQEILDIGELECSDDIIMLASAGEAGYSDTEAWINNHDGNTIVWKIIEV